MKILLVAFIALLLFQGCTDKDNAKRVLERDGYQNINIIGYSFLSCGRDDFYSTGFKATKGDNFVEGTVCSGLLFKYSTIRVK